MAKVNVSPTYMWVCSLCGFESGLSYMPELGKKLPACPHCGRRDTCGSITEDVRPEKKGKVK